MITIKVSSLLKGPLRFKTAKSAISSTVKSSVYSSRRYKFRGKWYTINVVMAPKCVIEMAEKKRRRKRRLLVVEKARSSRSKCKCCRRRIVIGEMRMGLITFIPHRNVKWFHLTAACLKKVVYSVAFQNCRGLEILSPELRRRIRQLWPVVVAPRPALSLGGEMNMYMMSEALTGRYNRFRSFRFALPEEQKYTSNWNWRCFLATLLVSNNREETMLYIVEKLFKEFPTQKKLLSLCDDEQKRHHWTEFMEKEKLKHAKMKMSRILNATRYLQEKYDGEIPKTRAELRVMRGVGAHVASVTLAWVYQAPEFGIDLHVRRIMERWGWIPEKMKESAVEDLVKESVAPDKLGHFSRAFVDHGQSVCGYIPDCANCYLNKACPAASKYLDW